MFSGCRPVEWVQSCGVERKIYYTDIWAVLVEPILNPMLPICAVVPRTADVAASWSRPAGAAAAAAALGVRRRLQR